MSTDTITPVTESSFRVGMQVTDIKRGMVVPETVMCGPYSIQNGKVHSVWAHDGRHHINVVGYSHGEGLADWECACAQLVGFPVGFGRPGNSIEDFSVNLDVVAGVVTGYKATGCGFASRGVATDFKELERTLKEF